MCRLTLTRAGLQTKIANVLQNTPVDRQEEEIKKLTADTDSCPLGIRHPPNGIEFGIGRWLVGASFGTTGPTKMLCYLAGCGLCNHSAKGLRANNDDKSEEEFKVACPCHQCV